MPIFHAVVLGLVQGLSEFLPISSSGHLLLVPWLLDWHDFDSPSTEKAFDVALHVGTIIAAVAYFRHDLVVYVREGAAAVLHPRRPFTPAARTAWLLVLSTVPAALVGAVLESWIDERLGTPTIIAFSLIFFGLLLFWADHCPARRSVEDYGVRDALIVGAAQALALNPGTSRSGITITAARWRRFDRDAAARLSFLMMLPVTIGAVAFKAYRMFSEGGIPEGLAIPMLVGIVTSAVSGWLAVWGTLQLVRTSSFLPFVIYRVLLGVFVLAVVTAGWR